MIINLLHLICTYLAEFKRIELPFKTTNTMPCQKYRSILVWSGYALGNHVALYPTNLSEHSLCNKNYRRTLAFNEVEFLCGNKTIVQSLLIKKKILLIKINRCQSVIYVER